MFPTPVSQHSALTNSSVAKIVSNTDISQLIWYHLVDLQAYFCVFTSDVNFTINTKYLENHNRHLSKNQDKTIQGYKLNLQWLLFFKFCLNLFLPKRKRIFVSITLAHRKAVFSFLLLFFLYPLA